MRQLKLCLLIISGFFITNLHGANLPERILVVGDSLSAAYGINPAQGWVSLLQQRLEKQHRWQVINASVSGETSGGGIARLPTLLTQHKPAIVIIELGGNDGLRGHPLKILQQNLDTMIDASKKSGAKVILVGMQIPTNYGARYAQEFKEIYPQLAEKNNVSLVQFLLEGVATNSGLMQNDRVHPKAEAQPLILENVWPVLEPIL